VSRVPAVPSGRGGGRVTRRTSRRHRMDAKQDGLICRVIAGRFLWGRRVESIDDESDQAS
jgi:hypothetical protein